MTLLPNFGGFHRTLQRVRLANRGRLLHRTPGPVPFGTCICSNVETILTWTCHVYGPFEFRTSLGTSILLFIFSSHLGIFLMMCIHVDLVWKYRALRLNYRIILFNTVTTFYQLVIIYNASVNKVNVNGVWVYCLLNVTFNDISVIYVTAHAVRAYWRSWTYGRDPTP